MVRNLRLTLNVKDSISSVNPEELKANVLKMVQTAVPSVTVHNITVTATSSAESGAKVRVDIHLATDGEEKKADELLKNTSTDAMTQAFGLHVVSDAVAMLKLSPVIDESSPSASQAALPKSDNAQQSQCASWCHAQQQNIGHTYCNFNDCKTCTDCQSGGMASPPASIAPPTPPPPHALLLDWPWLIVTLSVDLLLISFSFYGIWLKRQAATNVIRNEVARREALLTSNDSLPSNMQKSL